jgi:hypothetical protein
MNKILDLVLLFGACHGANMRSSMLVPRVEIAGPQNEDPRVVLYLGSTECNYLCISIFIDSHTEPKISMAPTRIDKAFTQMTVRLVVGSWPGNSDDYIITMTVGTRTLTMSSHSLYSLYIDKCSKLRDRRVSLSSHKFSQLMPL